MALIDRIPRNTISALYAGSIVDILSEMGAPKSEAKRRLGVTPLTLKNPKLRIDGEAMLDLFNWAADAIDHPVVALEVGFRFRVATFASSGSVLALCSTLKEAAEMNARYQPLVETLGVSSFEAEGERGFLQWRPIAPEAEDDRRRHLTELIVGGYVTTINWLSWSLSCPPPPVEFRHTAPDHPDAEAHYRRILRRLPRFGADHNRVEFPDGSHLEELPTSSPEQLRDMQRQLDALLYSDSSRARRQKLRGALTENLAEGLTKRDDLARKLDVSVYSLEKEMSDLGLTFRELLELVRRNEFHRLSKRGVPLAEIAFALGYNDQAAFTRAFQRWYGDTPGRYSLTI